MRGRKVDTTGLQSTSLLQPHFVKYFRATRTETKLKADLEEQ